MSNADVFRGLAQDMASAQEERTKRIAGIKKETAELLKDIGKESKERGAEVSTLLKGFDKEQKEMGTQLRAELSKVKPEIAKAEAERKIQAETEVKERSAEVSTLLKGFTKQSAERRAEVTKLLGDFGREDQERASDISKMLGEFDKEHQAMSAELKADLTKGEVDRRRSAEAEIKERKSEVSSLLAGFRKDSAETAAAWRDLVATMQAKRGAVAVALPPVKPPVAEVIIEEEVPLEEVVPEEKVRLEEEILSLIGEYPQGIKLVEIADRTGVARIKAGNVARMLVDEAKIRKEGLLYFPI